MNCNHTPQATRVRRRHILLKQFNICKKYKLAIGSVDKCNIAIPASDYDCQICFAETIFAQFRVLCVGHMV